MARIEGLIVSRHEPLPGAVPATAHFDSLLLECAGGYTYYDEGEQVERQADIAAAEDEADDDEQGSSPDRGA